jgi:hypothetical protein
MKLVCRNRIQRKEEQNEKSKKLQCDKLVFNLPKANVDEVTIVVISNK